MRSFIPITATMIAAMAVGAAVAQPPPPPFMPVGAKLSPPKGYLDLCEREPVECAEADNAGRPDIVLKKVEAARKAVWSLAFQAARDNDDPVEETKQTVLSNDPDTQALLRRVNTHVNNSMRSQPDARGADVWRTGLQIAINPVGDCEDFALEKRRELISAGVDSRTLSLATAMTPRGETHAVLIVATETGDVVLDNRYNKIVSWSQASLRWELKQSGDHPLEWRSAGRARLDPMQFEINRRVADGAENLSRFVSNLKLKSRAQSLLAGRATAAE
ncbi:hypothetical protein BH11PSE2_BH11PSE2_11900 [soil metagenome]